MTDRPCTRSCYVSFGSKLSEAEVANDPEVAQRSGTLVGQNSERRWVCGYQYTVRQS